MKVMISMKTKIIIIVSVVIGLSLTAVTAFYLINSYKIKTDTAKTGQIIFEYADAKISDNLSDEDLTAIKQIFDGKATYNDIPSCGFSDKIAVVLDGSQVFCIACDDCPTICYKNKGKYFSLSDEENETLRSILKKYGFTFPCV